MSRPKPTEKEVTFEFNELFFSKTDERGVIEFGNNVFINISGYSKEELIGAAHNIIRHPDMPRSVFKLFWDTLLGDKPVAAYVKNMNAVGSYYWVFAMAFPVSNGYLSIRLRPSSEFFKKAKSIYRAVLEEETKTAMNGGSELLLRLLKENGLPDYPTFMTLALRAEIEARDSHLRTNTTDSVNAQDQLGAAIKNIRRICDNGAATFHNLFEMVDQLNKSKDTFAEKTAGILKSFKGIHYISFNMIIAANKLGREADTLAVISAEFQKLATQIEGHLNGFIESTELIGHGIQQTSLNICALKLQMDMVDFFVRESLLKSTKDAKSIGAAFSDIYQNRQDFVELSKKSAAQIQSDLNELKQKLLHFEKTMIQISTFTSSLDIVRQMGAIESARDNHIQAVFQNQIQGLKDFTETLQPAIRFFQDLTQDLSRTAEDISHEVTHGSKALQQIFDVTTKLQENSSTTKKAS